MENLFSQLGLEYNAEFPSTSTFQSLELDTSGSITNWMQTPNPRPCKDVLRQAIRVSRIKKGQVMPVIDKESTIPKKRKKPMQGYIPEDIQLRRQKNREAAKKCRLKKRTVMEKWRQKIEKYENMNRSLENDIKNFTDERTKLQRLLDRHKCGKIITHQQHSQQVETGSSSHSVTAPDATPVENIADSLDDLLSELQDNEHWCKELEQFM